MVKIGILTYEKLPQLADDDQLLLAAFSRRGVLATPLIWSQDTGEKFDLILIRTPWDYFLRQQEFGLWLAGRAQSGTRFLNDVRVIRWNIHKFYLEELAAEGLPVVETVFVRQGDADRGFAEATRRQWPRWVLKPAVSAGAHETRVLKLPLSAENSSWAQNLASREDVLIQPFIREIETRGELSIVVIAGQVSHAYLKKPRAGDFRVQMEFGGTVEQVQIEPWHREWAEKILLHAQIKSGSSEPLAFARVDLIPLGSGAIPTSEAEWCLSELELFEPALNLEMAPFAADQLAELAIIQAQWPNEDED
jgi:glutathione synthase/RimK-type ligase-like ATP-grasp enzyme